VFFQNSARNQHDGLLEIEGLDLPRVHFGDPETCHNLLTQNIAPASRVPAAKNADIVQSLS